ncbi:uncharacterized protein LOC135683748 [Rhopilema esculentum]|uniref:uncharacterized protein LOC135683748 n=1 Tax=Rhopilema esculentum TaxID=499914 RepID=UPI0031D393D9|eukprot:gene15036-6197_t
MELESELNDCDIILQLLDENFFADSAELQLDFERAVDEVQENIVECPECQKVYKTKGGLRRHQKAKHPDPGHKPESPELDLTQDIYENLVNNGAKSLASDLCLPPAERAAFLSYTFKVDNCHATNGLHLAQNLFKVLVHKANAAKFYKVFYAQFVAKANSYLPELSEQQAVFLAMKLADSLLVVQEEQKPSADMGMPQVEITEKEKLAMQYLGGYVLFNLNKKFHHARVYSKLESQNCIMILQAGRYQDDSSQKLIESLNRGGLWYINNIVQQILLVTEMAFRRHTTNIIATKEIDTNKIINTLVKEVAIKALYENWVTLSEVSIDEAVAQDLLEKILSLYIRVRAFSCTKDIVNKYRKKHKKDKALRRGLKKADEADN